MKNKIIIIIILIILFYIFLFFTDHNKKIEKICFKENCFNLEIADDNKERENGLMFREELCSNCGMLFIYEKEGDYKFWMKNTLIPLDIIWLDENFEVIYIANAVPCIKEKCELYGKNFENSKYVLEINYGFSEKIGMKVGDEMRIIE